MQTASTHPIHGLAAEAADGIRHSLLLGRICLQDAAPMGDADSVLRLHPGQMGRGGQRRPSASGWLAASDVAALRICIWVKGHCLNVCRAKHNGVEHTFPIP